MQKRCTQNIFILLILLLLLAIPLSCHADSDGQLKKVYNSEPKEKTILLIISYDESLPFYQYFIQGVKNSVSNSQENVTLITEYLDVLRYEQNEYLSKLADLYTYKISTLHPDVIIITEWTGYSMLNSTGIISSSKIPILYYGDVPKDLILPDNVILYNFPITIEGFNETISLIQDLQPSTKQIAIIVGNGSDEQQGLVSIRQVVSEMNLSIPVKYITDVSYDELISEVSDLPKDTGILFYLFLRDKNGNDYIPINVLQELNKRTNNPIFGLYDTYLGKGIIGGYIFSAEILGEDIGSTAIKIIDGNLPGNPSVNTSIYHSYMFDWRELQKQSISINKLPPESQILFIEESFWEHYWPYILILFCILLIESILIIVLLIERKNRIIAEVNLKQSEERFRILIDQAPEAIIVFDADISKIVDANLNAEKLFSTKRDDLLKKGIQDYYSEVQPDNLPIEITILDHINKVKTSEEVVFERTIRQPSGKEVICEVRIVLLPSDDHLLIRGSYIDITERKNSEELLEKRVFDRTRELNRIQEAYKQANQKLNLLTGITRHDILNAITGLKGYLEFSLEEKLPANAETYLTKCYEITEQIQRLIQFTRIYENIGGSVAIWQDISKIINNVRVMLKGSPLIFYDETENLQVYADPMLEKVFFTLVENTLRHGEKATEVRFHYEKTDDGVILVYSDNGIGIPKDKKLSIFKRGYGMHTGLGLYISQEILTITHLAISETGEYGMGARFEIFIPQEYCRFDTNNYSKISDRTDI